MSALGNPSPILVVAALIVVQILFGINYVVSKVVVTAFPPLVWASIRVFVAAVVMVSVALAARRPHPQDGKKFFIPLITFSLLGILINQGSFLVGLHYTTAANSAVLNTLIPVFTLMVVTLRGQEPLTLRRAAGFFSAFAGVLVIRRVEDLTLSSETLLGDSLTVLNCLSYAFFLSYSKKFLQTHDRLWTTAWLFVYGVVGFSVAAVPEYLTFQPPEFTHELIVCMIFSILGGTIATYFLNLWALTYAKPSSVALFIYMQPAVASLLDWAWHGHQITSRTLLSSSLIFIGMLLALAPKTPPAAAVAAAGVAPKPHI